MNLRKLVIFALIILGLPSTFISMEKEPIIKVEEAETETFGPQSMEIEKPKAMEKETKTALKVLQKAEETKTALKALAKAIVNNNSNNVKIILDAKPELLNMPSELLEGSPLAYAIRMGEYDIARLLVDKYYAKISEEQTIEINYRIAHLSETLEKFKKLNRNPEGQKQFLKSIENLVKAEDFKRYLELVELKNAILNGDKNEVVKIINAKPTILTSETKLTSQLGTYSIVGYAITLGGRNEYKMAYLLLDKGAPVSNQEIILLDKQIDELKSRIWHAKKGYRKEYLKDFEKFLSDAEKLKSRIQSILIKK
jgi:hypothetical protein